MTVVESAGSVTMPPLTGTLDGLWEVILDLADTLPPMSWALVGGQMVMAHGLAAGRTPTRASQDVDILGNLTASSTALRTVVTAVRDLGFEPEPSIDGKRLHRFVRTTDNQVIDILAPDHSPPGWKPTTVPPLQTIQIAGGNQAPQRLVAITVTKGGHISDVPVPSILGSLILKAAAYQADSRDRERHAADATFLVSLITDPLDLARQLKAVIGSGCAYSTRPLGRGRIPSGRASALGPATPTPPGSCSPKGTHPTFNTRLTHASSLKP